MNAQVANNYLKTKVFTATPEQLQLMLYDGALRFGEQARAALAKRNFEESYRLIARDQRILTELSGSLKHDVAPELCGKLAALYTDAYRQLVEANVGHEMAPLEEALGILRYQRETWVLLLDQLSKTKASAIAQRLDMPAPNARMEASIRLTG